jgi:hypothetical protein
MSQVHHFWITRHKNTNLRSSLKSDMRAQFIETLKNSAQNPARGKEWKFHTFQFQIKLKISSPGKNKANKNEKSNLSQKHLLTQTHTPIKCEKDNKVELKNKNKFNSHKDTYTLHLLTFSALNLIQTRFICKKKKIFPIKLILLLFDSYFICRQINNTSKFSFAHQMIFQQF